MNKMGYKIKLTAKAKDFIAERGWDENYGARPLKRAIQKYIEDQLAEEIIKTSLAEGDTVTVDYDSKKEDIKIKVSKARKKAQK
jgi:ATP-dependent Clp protease ATP-binding subunit ClpC